MGVAAPGTGLWPCLTYGESSANGTVRDAERICEIISGYLAEQGFGMSAP